jgi:hypothetical protein
LAATAAVIYPILYESLLLTALFICFHVVEHIAIGLFEGETLAASVPHIGGGGEQGNARGRPLDRTAVYGAPVNDVARSLAPFR